jgi:hypothetical protein
VGYNMARALYDEATTRGEIGIAIAIVGALVIFALVPYLFVRARAIEKTGKDSQGYHLAAVLVLITGLLVMSFGMMESRHYFNPRGYVAEHYPAD